ncbi:MAG TPA: ATP-binding protein [Actinomycetota bacterium]|nr:ATP-binding protein [Actinomycetota bacterium]
MRPPQGSGITQDEPGMRGLWLGILAYRWAAFAWMVTLAVVSRADMARPALAVVGLAVTGAWSLWFSLDAGWERSWARATDLAIAVALVGLSGFVMDPGATAGSAPFFATSYPAAAALTVGAGSGVVAGLWAGVLLSVGLGLSRPLNDLPLSELSSHEWAALVNGAFYYVAAGGAAGVVSRVLRTSAAARALALEEAGRERERAARLAEREALGRQIHDSVLQSLALVGKKGRELTETSSVPAEEVRELLELAERQEQELRALLSEPAETAPGMVSLRTALRSAAFGVDGLEVTISAAGGLWLPAAQVEDVSGAVRQALENVRRHADATRATVFAEELEGELIVSVRDDGVGFVYDETLLRREGKLGMLGSMKGRMEGLGGTMRVRTAPGRGTEIEFRLPTHREDEG